MLHLAIWTTIAAAALLMSFQAAGDRVGRWVTALQTLTPWIMPLLLVAIVGATAAGHHRAGMAGGLVAAALLALVAPLVFPPDLGTAAGPDRLSVLHANLLHTNPDIDAAIAVMLDADADVIAVSELTEQFAEAIGDSPVGNRYPSAFLRPDRSAGGLGIWSRQPIDDVLLESNSTTLTVTTHLGGRTVRVVLTHPHPPIFDAPRWQREIDSIAALPREHRAATVIVGDFNVSYFNPPYRRLVDELEMTDVHQAFGRGFSVSWPTDATLPPFVRLDHTLLGRDLTATAIADIDLPGSDHRAFVVTVAWAQGSEENQAPTG